MECRLPGERIRIEIPAQESAASPGLLPACSNLVSQLAPTARRDNISKPYMEQMTRAGIRRLMFEVESVWHDGGAHELRITRRLYFSAYDDPNSLITDPQRLNELKSGEMRAVLDKAVLEQAASAVPLHGIDSEHWNLKNGQLGYCRVELFDVPRFTGVHPRILPLAKDASSRLNRAATSGDEMELKQILESSGVPTRDALNEALIAAAGSRYNNSSIIDLLLSHGADINVHGKSGVTPLINAVASPCNLATLLAKGANINERDRWGHTALELAKDGGRAQSERLLEQASSSK